MRARILFALALSACATPEPDVSELESEIKNGTVWDPWTHTTQTWTRNVVSINDNGCTGTLLDYEWVLTASHCFDADTQAQTIKVEHTLADGSIETAHGVELLIHPLSTHITGDEDNNVDAALIRVDVPMNPGVATLPLVGGTTDDLVGTTVFCAGYGRLDTNVPNDGQLRAASFTIIEDPYNADIWYRFDVPNSSGAILMPGDSGSSCWNGSGLTGAHKAGNGTDYNRQTAAPAFRAWVNGIVTPTIVKQVNQPAAYCRPIGSDTIAYGVTGQIQNTSTGTADVLCPIKRPQPQVVDVVSVPRLWVFDQHPTQDVCCNLQSKNPGAATKISETVCSDGNSAGYQSLILPSVVDSYSFSQFSINCSIPPTTASGASGIHGYRAVLADR